MKKIGKVLIAEDEDVARTILVHIVEGLGHAAIQSSCGSRAWDVLVDNPDIRLLITDIAMPGKDGRELISSVKKHDKLHNLPIIIVSGVVTPNEISSLLELGASRFLPKPVDAKILKDYIKSYL